MPTAKWHQEKTLRTVARIRREAAEWMKGIANGTNPEANAVWKERSVRTGCALALLGHQAAAERAAVAAKSVGASFGVVVIQQKIENHGEWEQFAKDRGQQVIDTTAGPALLETNIEEAGHRNRDADPGLHHHVGQERGHAGASEARLESPGSQKDEGGDLREEVKEERQGGQGLLKLDDKEPGP